MKIGAAVAAAVVLGILAAPANANDRDTDVDAEDDHGAFGVSVGQATHGTSGGNMDSTGSIGTWHQTDACIAFCEAAFVCPDGENMTYSWLEGPNGEVLWSDVSCPSDGPPPVTPGLVSTAFQRIPLPPSTFTIQPPGGKTLVNFDTNFFTEKETLYRTVRLLGRRVELRIDAHSYTWHFGDGESISTTKPGAPFPKLQITHNYLAKDSYRPSLDTTWVADYRVDGGAWQAVPGSVTIAGTPVDLRAIEARPTLVGYEG